MNNLNNMQNSSSYEQKKNNGKGIFYGVIAVATLIVAIIGATFAYFTAQASSSEGALAAQAAVVEVNYTEGRQIKATNLIPSSSAVVAYAYNNPTAYDYNLNTAQCTYNGNEANPESYTASASWTGCTNGNAKSTGDVGTKCVDDNGYYVCAVYQFTASNISNVRSTLNANLTVVNNEFMSHVDSSADEKDEDSLSGTDTALKFMAVRSDHIINTDVTDCTSAQQAGLYDRTVTGASPSGTPTPSNMSKVFCSDTYNEFQTAGKGYTQAMGTTDIANKFDIWDENTVDSNDYFSDRTFTDYSKSATDSKGNHALTDGNGMGIFTDSSGYYYFFNTTSVAMSLGNNGDSQNIFTNDVLPAVGTNYLTSSNGRLYVHTNVNVSSQITQSGTSDNPYDFTGVIVDDLYGEIYVYGGDGTYDDKSNALAACEANKAAIANCVDGYVTTSDTAYDADADPGTVDDKVFVFGQVNKTYYIVAWLQESNHSQDVDQGKSFSATITVTTGGTGGAGGVTGYRG